jgi:D-3-phosphoglycerate dehydrogenase
MIDDTSRIAVLDTGYESYSYEEDQFTRNGYRFDMWSGDKGDTEGKTRFAEGAVGLLVRFTVVDDAFLARLPGLKAVARYGVGYDNIDVPAATRAGVRVSNVQGYANHAVSDHAIALMYACARGLPQGQRAVGKTHGNAPFRNMPEFHDKTIGIVGLGRIGGTLCSKVRHLFGRVVACDPYIDSTRFVDLGAKQVDLHALLELSDVISVHCNLTEETAGMFDDNAFAAMAKCPVLVNTARGPVVDENALLRALEDGGIHSAGIDVYRSENPAELPKAVITHPKVIATGHYAWYSERSHVELQRRAADNLLCMLEGGTPEDCLNPEAG